MVAVHLPVQGPPRALRQLWFRVPRLALPTEQPRPGRGSPGARLGRLLGGMRRVSSPWRARLFHKETRFEPKSRAAVQHHSSLWVPSGTEQMCLESDPDLGRGHLLLSAGGYCSGPSSPTPSARPCPHCPRCPRVPGEAPKHLQTPACLFPQTWLLWLVWSWGELAKGSEDRVYRGTEQEWP